MTVAVLLCLLYLVISTTHVTAACSKTLNTLTSDCNGQCSSSDYNLCVIYDAEASNNYCYADEHAAGDELSACRLPDDNDCQYQCFSDVTESTQFFFLIPESSESIDSFLGESHLKYIRHLSNEYIEQVGALAFRRNVTYVQIQAGVYSGPDHIGEATAKVSFADDLLRYSPNIDNLDIVGIDFKSEPFINLEKAKSKYLRIFQCEDCHLQEVPTSIANVNQLQKLVLTYNNFTSFPKDFTAMDNLESLEVYENQLSSFAAAPPNLVNLRLEKNKLTSIPLVIGKMIHLQTLNLTDNPISNFDVTQETFDVLSNLLEFNIDPPRSKPDCAVPQLIGSKSFCIVLEDYLQTDMDEESQSLDTDESGSSDESTINVLYIAIPIAIIILLAVVGIWYCIHKRRSQRKALSPSMNNSTETTTGTYTPAESLKAHSVTTESKNSLWTEQERLELQVRVSDIQDVRKLGGGAFAEVWLVKYCGAQWLASKRPIPGKSTVEDISKFVAEIKLAAKLDHPKIVRFFGAAWTTEAKVQALFEYMENGDLRSYLMSSDTPRHWTQRKVEIAIDVADALVYVHSFNPPLIHRDLKSRNVLLSSEMDAKLADFGVSKYWSDESTMTQGIGTARWLAPEVVSGQRDYDESSDIFSFGAFLTELDTHELPYYDVRNDAGIQLSEMAIMSRVSIGQLCPTVSKSCPTEIKKVAMQCLSFDAKRRPTAAQIAYNLRTILKSLSKR